jgi:hypothetical protein
MIQKIKTLLEQANNEQAQINDIPATHNPNANDQSTFPEVYSYGLTSESLTEGQIITISGLGTQTDSTLERSVSLDGTYLITFKNGEDTRLKKIDTSLETISDDHYQYYDYDTPANHSGFSATSVTYSLFAAGEEKGGRFYHSVSVAEMPSHNHVIPAGYRGDDDMEGALFDDDGNRGGGDSINDGTFNDPNNSPHNNRQPSRQVYMYKRIS